jgi:hypothetical protein
MKAVEVKCCVPLCEETVITSWEEQYRPHKCRKHVREDQIQRAMDRDWEARMAQKAGGRDG